MKGGGCDCSQGSAMYGGSAASDAVTALVGIDSYQTGGGAVGLPGIGGGGKARAAGGSLMSILGFKSKESKAEPASAHLGGKPVHGGAKPAAAKPKPKAAAKPKPGPAKPKQGGAKPKPAAAKPKPAAAKPKPKPAAAKLKQGGAKPKPKPAAAKPKPAAKPKTHK